MKCIECKKNFNDSDAHNFEKFCSASCEAIHEHEWREFKKEELEFEALEDIKASTEKERRNN